MNANHLIIAATFASLRYAGLTQAPARTVGVSCERISMEYIKSTSQDGNELAEIRTSAMKPSLEALGRFDDNRVRSRFLETFNPEDTFKITEANELMGFYVVRFKEDHCYLDHLI